jgi:transcriptional regulator with XRE-family HTH domain
MYLAHETLKRLCKTKGLSLRELLNKANVSKTAYYHLVYKDSLLPNSVHALADVLDVRPSAFLEEVHTEGEKIIKIAALTDKIIADHPELDRENVRHTLLLLQEEPVERLRRGLIRGQKINIFS